MTRGTERLVRSAPVMNERPDRQPPAQGADAVWTIISLLVAGPVAWAGIGWLVDRIAGTSMFLPIGVVIGFIGSLYLVYVKYGRA